MRKTILFLGFAAVALAWACNSDSSNDGGTDATTEPVPDLCSTFTSSGQPCSHASTRVCFPVCEAGGGCMCKASDAGPIWECTNPPECQPCNSSPLADAACPDAGDAGDGGAGGDAGDAADASSD